MAVLQPFLGWPKSEFSGHAATNDANILFKKILIGWILAVSCLVRLQSQKSTLSSSTHTLLIGVDNQVTLKTHNSVLDHLGATHIFSLCGPFFGSRPIPWEPLF